MENGLNGRRHAWIGPVSVLVLLVSSYHYVYWVFGNLVVSVLCLRQLFYGISLRVILVPSALLHRLILHFMICITCCTAPHAAVGHDSLSWVYL
jgi:hypothetical protein